MDPRVAFLGELVKAFVRSEGLESYVQLTYSRLPDGKDLISLNPKSPEAARVDLVVSPLKDQTWAVDVYVNDDERPIELLGPWDVNGGRPRHRTEQTLLDLIRLVTDGKVFVDEGEFGEIIGVDIPDPYDQSASQWEGRKSLAPWRQ